MFDPNGPIEVLVVDDDPFIIKVVDRTLRERGFDVVSAANGREAFQLLSERGPALVITDWMMPEVDGLELCRRIRSSLSCDFTYVILLTGNDRREHLIRAFEEGVDDYMTKPFDQRELLARIRAAERIIRLEAFYRQHVVQLHKVNAQVAVANGQLNRLTRQLGEARKEAAIAARSAADANLAKSAFLANMSHELRTPMTAILGFAESLLESKLSDAEHDDVVRTILRNGECLLGMLNDLLDLSKIETGKMTVERIPCDPCEIVADAASLIRVRAEAKRLTFDIEYETPIPKRIRTDPTRLRQILINLLSNAIKFTDRGGVRLLLRVLHDGGAPRLQFEIADTGIGISNEQMSTLFQPFRQADDSTTRRFGGTGLGLSISKRFAERLGGDVWIVESREGTGTRIRVTVATDRLDGVNTVPATTYSAYAVSSPTVANPAPGGSDLAPARILLAEDGPDNQRLIALMLKKAGARVTVKDNGKRAVETALAARTSGEAFDVILMDMQMPVMDGYEATRRLRREGYTGPIIALTAHAMSGDRQKCIQAGCDDYATKPINRQTLVNLIAARLEPVRLAPCYSQ